MGAYLFFIRVFDIKYCGEHKDKNVDEKFTMPYHGVHCMLSTEILVLLLTYLMMDMYFMFVLPFSKIHPGKQQTAVILISLWIDGLFVPNCISKQEPVFRLWPWHTSKLFHHSPSQLGRVTPDSHYCHGQNTFDLGKLSEFIANQTRTG